MPMSGILAGGCCQILRDPIIGLDAKTGKQLVFSPSSPSELTHRDSECVELHDGHIARISIIQFPRFPRPPDPRILSLAPDCDWRVGFGTDRLEGGKYGQI